MPISINAVGTLESYSGWKFSPYENFFIIGPTPIISASASSAAKHKNNVKKMDKVKLDDSKDLSKSKLNNSSKNASHEKATNKQPHDEYKIEKVSKAVSKIN